MSFANGTFGNNSCKQSQPTNQYSSQQEALVESLQSFPENNSSDLLSLAADSNGVKLSKHQLMSQINDEKTYETLAAINEMLLITQNYLLQRPDLFDCKGEASSQQNASIEELKQSLAARVKTLNPVLNRVTQKMGNHTLESKNTSIGKD